MADGVGVIAVCLRLAAGSAVDSGYGPVDADARVTTAFKTAAVKAYVGSLVNHEVFSPLVSQREPEEYEAILKLGKAAVPAMIGLLVNDEWEFRVGASMALERITNKRFAPHQDLVAQVPLLVVDRWRKWWLANSEKSQLDWFAEDLTAPDEDVRLGAVTALDRLGDVGAVGILRPALNDDDRTIRFRAARALARLRDGCAIPHLIELYLPDGNIGFRREGLALLQSLTSTTLGYDPMAPERDRAAARLRWQYWWTEHKKEYCH